jgi:thiol:disulfide interchange protein DsbA
VSGKRAIVLAVLPTLAALLLAACSGGDGTTDEGSAAPPPVPNAISEADQGTDASAAATAGGESRPTSERFELGSNYVRLSPTQPTSSSPTQVEVAEVFWYGCPHCYRFDAYLKRWNADKPTYIHFLRIPAVWNPVLRLHARAFYTAEALGKGDAMHDAFFQEIHENGNPLDSEDKLAEFFARFGVDAQTFQETFDSYAVQEKLQQADELNRRYRIESVPSLVVNGKYVTSGGMVGSYEELLELVDELAASERAEEH